MWTSAATAQEDPTTTTTSEPSTTTTSTVSLPPSPSDSGSIEQLTALRSEVGFALVLTVFSLGMLCGIKVVR